MRWAAASTIAITTTRAKSGDFGKSLLQLVVEASSTRDTI